MRDLSAARAVLIGNASYRPDSGIPDLPAASSCVAAMAELLTGDLCGWPAERITMLVDVAAPSDLARRLVAAVRDARDTVLVYYVGHGLRTSEGQLALTLADTDNHPESLPYTGIPYEAIARILRGCAAPTKLVILDCCHAELGTRVNYVFQSAEDIAETYPVDGLYFIGASRMHQKAKAPVDGHLTYFTAAFLDTVRTGIPGRSPLLRLDEIFLELRGRLLRANLPEPVESGTRGAHQYPFARNAAMPEPHPERETSSTTEEQPTPTAHPAPARHSGVDPSRGRVTLTRAEQIARRITDPESQVTALCSVARALAAIDPGRARMILADAEQIALGSTNHPVSQAIALGEIAGALGGVDPGHGRVILGRAEKSARKIADLSHQVFALTGIARALAGVDPKRSRMILKGAERIAGRRGIENRITRDIELGRIAGALVLIDSDRAEQIARDIADPYTRASALCEVAGALAAADSGRTRRILTDAELTARSLGHRWQRIPILIDVARALVAVDLGHSRVLLADVEQLARSSGHPISEVNELCEVAAALVAVDLGHSRVLLADAEQLAHRITNPDSRNDALRRIAEALAAADPARAEQVARGITDPSLRAFASNQIVRVLAANEPDLARAEQLALGATDSATQSLMVRRLVATVPSRTETRPGGSPLHRV